MSGFAALAERARALYDVGVAAAEPGAAVARHMSSVLADPPGQGGRWQIIALGKAAGAMCAAAMVALPQDSAALVVTNRENAAPLAGARVLAAGHPEPDEDGAAAARAVEACLAALGPQDRLLALISGGGSALLPAPVAGVSLTDKRAVNALLLASGADIGEVNLVRQSLSRLKGGGWLRATRASVSALILSDVPADDLRVVASGPTVAPIGTPEQARALCHRLGIWEALPASARRFLALAPQAMVPVPLAPVRNILIGSNALSLQSMQRAGARLADFPLSGDVDAMAHKLVAALKQLPCGQALALGGETTVQLRGAGLGGRNQELALRVAVLAEAQGLAGDWACLAAGTDGKDGPTEAAGGLVGPDSLATMRRAGVEPVSALARNDSHPALAAAKALVIPGATGTNVADLVVLVRG
jgi:glycerate 2-kinase